MGLILKLNNIRSGQPIKFGCPFVLTFVLATVLGLVLALRSYCLCHTTLSVLDVVLTAVLAVVLLLLCKVFLASDVFMRWSWLLFSYLDAAYPPLHSLDSRLGVEIAVNHIRDLT